MRIPSINFRKPSTSQWLRIGHLITLFVLVGALVLLLLLALATMFSPSVANCLSDLLGLKSTSQDSKYQTLTTIAIVMGGVVVAIQAWLAARRAKAMEEGVKAQADATRQLATANKTTEQGQRQERMKVAIEHLASDNPALRLGGMIELHHLARDVDVFRQSIVDIFCAHIRRTTSLQHYVDQHESEPSEEIQTLLTFMFVDDASVFGDLRVDLTGSWLNGASLADASLCGAKMYKVHMQGANLDSADLRKTDFREAHLQGTRLYHAQMQEANFALANLQGVTLSGAQMQICHLARARLQGASISWANLQGSDLSNAHMEGVSLGRAELQYATMFGVYLQGANDEPWPGFMPFVDHIRMLVGENTNLTRVVLQGGMSEEKIQRLREGLSKWGVDHLRDGLIAHIGKPESCELPDNSAVGGQALELISVLIPESEELIRHAEEAPTPTAAFTGAYTREDADLWIAKYPQWVADKERADMETDEEFQQSQEGDR